MSEHIYEMRMKELHEVREHLNRVQVIAESMAMGEIAQAIIHINLAIVYTEKDAEAKRLVKEGE